MKSRHPAKNSPPTGTLLRLGCMAVLLGFALAVSAAAAGAETCISTGPGSQNNARISGDWIVWVDKSDGYDIILYNLTTLTFTRFTGIPDQDYPSIDGNLVVWQGDNPEHLTTDIFLYDISRRNLTNLINDLQDFQYFPDVSGDRIVWVDDRHWSTSRWDVYLYNVTTHTESRISSDSADQDDPAIDGNYVVWEDFRNGNADIFLYDIPAGQLTPLVTGTSNQHYPRISGTRVVYQDDRNGYQDIYLYDFLTSQETRITSNESGSYFPKIDGDRIVWTDYRNGNADIYLHNITTGVETRITTDPYDQVGPDISGNRIVWMDKRQGDHNVYAIYLYTLDGTPDPDPTPIPTPTPTPTPIPEQLVMTTGTATTYTYLGYTSTYLQQAQSFKVADTGISRVAVALAKRGSPILDITLSVRTTVKGPDLSRATIVPSRVTSTDYKKPTWVEVPLDLRGKLTKGSTCYVVLSVSSSDSRNCYLVPLNGYNPFKEGYLYKNTIGSQTASSEMLMKVWFTDGAPMPPPAPTADFSGTPVSGNAPLEVQFTDASTGTISSYVWDFGDGNTSTQ
ncbi:MAG: hypothetical protein LUQ62_06315, partial [Methanomicrobiales archaeon]|nr:hypothetical protein [Methanomicrobiales archaeon]